jgi:phenylpropionate dioxygenase-like ring-hydroxylating dioxygenase large terminal subunit
MKEMMSTLVRTGAGTPTGNLLRRFWIPIMLSSEIAEPDGPQIRIQILGEKLLAFRDTAGRPGLISEFCSHRGASLYFGRNEENGIRCSYHGLKFDVTGKCIDVPQAPQVCERMSITGYPCIERAGILWAYMGPKDQQPEEPGVEWANLPEDHVFVSKRMQECNYLQAMEGGIDTSHVSFVHRFEVDGDPLHQGTKANEYIKKDGNVVFEVERHEGGLTLFGRRKGEPDSWYWRVTQWIFPWFNLIPPFGDHSLAGHVWVPIDDHHCWAWSINFRPDKALSAQEREDLQQGKGVHCPYEPGTNVPGGTWRPVANKDNDYLIDRQAQKERRAFSGVFGFAAQDASLQESMGPIQNHAAEKLLPSDRAIVMMRRMLWEATNNLEEGKEPPALGSEAQSVRAAGVLLPLEQKPQEWAKVHLVYGKDQKVYTL